MMLTIEDIRNPQRTSGFDHVYNAGGQGRGHGGGKPWMAAAEWVKNDSGTGTKPSWRGARRATTEEAAQDYCDHINGSGVSPATQLRTAGHNGKRSTPAKPPEVEAAEGLMRDWRGQLEGRQGYVYCIAEAEGLHPLVKIGYSTNPQARVAELQTGNGRQLFLLGCFAGTMEDEKRLHGKYLDDNTLMEWFRPSNELLSEFGYDVYDLYEKGSASLK